MGNCWLKVNRSLQLGIGCLGLALLLGGWATVDQSTPQGSKDYADIATSIAGNYAGSLTNVAPVAGAAISYAGGQVRLALSADIAGAGCGSAIGSVVEMTKRLYPVDTADITFAFDPGKCAGWVMGRQVVVNAFGVHSGRPRLSISLLQTSFFGPRTANTVYNEGMFDRQ
jgi:hypothetical protein